MTGKPSLAFTSAAIAGAMSQSAVVTPDCRKSCFDKSLSIARALARWPLPVYGTPVRLSIAWIVPSSPVPPCNPRKTTSVSPALGSVLAILGNASRAILRNASWDGGAVCTTVPPARPRCSSRVISPRAGSTARTSCPRDRSASTTLMPEASDTSRSEDLPPISTVIRRLIADVPLAGHEVAQHVGPRHDPLHESVLAYQHSRVRFRKQFCDAVYRLAHLDHRERRIHHFAYGSVEELRVVQAPRRQRPIAHRSDAIRAVHHGQLR